MASKNELKDWFEASREMTAMRIEEVRKFNEILREPDMTLVFEDEDDERFTEILSYWRVPGGVLKKRKFTNGYQPNDGVFIPTRELRALSSLMDRESKDMFGE